MCSFQSLIFAATDAVIAPFGVILMEQG